MGNLTALSDPPDVSSVPFVFDLVTATPANPTELNAIGTTDGDLRCVYPVTAGTDGSTWYRLDTSSAAVNAPYVMASLTAGKRWIAFAGTYMATAANFAAAVVSLSTLTGTQLVSNIATGTPPLVVTSTTNVPNLNASSLSGATFAAPGAIGGTTPGTGAFTTLSATGVVTLSNATDATSVGTGALVVSAGGISSAGQIRCGTILTATTRVIGVSAAFSSYGVESSTGFGATQTTTNVSGTYTMDCRRIANTSASGTHQVRAISSSQYGTIATGQTNSGTWIGSHTESLRNYVVTGDTGGLSALTAYNINFGHFNQDASTPSTTTATGLNINPFCVTGTITQGYGIHLQTPTTGGTLTAYTALQIDNTAGTSSKAISTGTGIVSFGDTTSASSSTAGAATFGNGVTATSVAIGAGIVWAGGVLRSNAGIGVLKNGSDTFNSGGTIALNNAANTDGVWLQNSASGHLDIWGYVASVATKVARLTNVGIMQFTKGIARGVTSNATVSGTITLTVSSTNIQTFTGSTAGTVVQFPAANLLGAGISVEFTVNNQSSVSVTPTRAGSDTFQGGGTTDTVTAGTTTRYASDGVSVWMKV